MILDIEDYVNSAVTDFKKNFESDITLGNIIDAVSVMMKIVGKFETIPGQDKKLIVTKLITILVRDSGHFDSTLEDVIVYVVPSTIDNLISVEKGKLSFNKRIHRGCLAFLKK